MFNGRDAIRFGAALLTGLSLLVTQAAVMGPIQTLESVADMVDTNPIIYTTGGKGRTIYVQETEAFYTPTNTWNSTNTARRIASSTTDWAWDKEESIGSANIHINVKEFGATGDGLTDDTVAINAAATYAKALYSTNATTYYLSRHPTVLFPPGNYITSATVEFWNNVESQGAIIYPTNNTFTVVRLGDGTNTLTGVRANLPGVSGLNSTWATANTNCVAVEVRDVKWSEISLGPINFVNKGLFVNSTIDKGNGYNSYRVSLIAHSQKAIHSYASGSGWSNENTFWGGAVSQDVSVFGEQQTGWYHVRMESGGSNDPQNNRFVGFSFEGGSSEYWVELYDATYTLFEWCRWEKAGTAVNNPQVLFDGSSCRWNELRSGFQSDRLDIIYANSGRLDVLQSQGNQWRVGAIQTNAVLNLVNQGGSTWPSLRVFPAITGGTNWIDVYTNYVFQVQGDGVTLKGEADADSRLKLLPSGTVQFNTGTGTQYAKIHIPTANVLGLQVGDGTIPDTAQILNNKLLVKTNMTVDGSIIVNGANGILIKGSGDADYRFRVLDNGSLYGGDGTGTQEWRIYRPGASRMMFQASSTDIFEITATKLQTYKRAEVDSNAANGVGILTLENTAGDIEIFRVDATPEGSVTGSIGDFVLDGTGGNAYLKTSGSASNTGWELIQLAVVDADGLDAAIGTETTGTGDFVRADDATVAGLQLGGETTQAGVMLTPVNALGAFVINTAKTLNTKTVAGDETFTFSGAPSTDSWFNLLLTSTSATNITVDIPSSYSVNHQTTVTDYTQGPNSKVLLTWQYNGATYDLYGAPVWIGELTLDSSPATTDLVELDGARYTTVGDLVSAGNIVFKSYTYASRPAASGENFLAGFYDYNTADSTLTIGGSVTQTHGGANVPYGAHAFCVASGAGGTDLVLTVSGTSVTDAGVRTGADSQVIVADTDVASTDEYFESSKKWVGQITFTLTGAAGAFTFNYGLAKYEDFGNRAFTVTDFEAMGLANANDGGFNIELVQHEPDGWTYSAAAFQAGGAVLASMNTDYVTEIDNDSGEPFAFKRAGLSVAVDGSGEEGLVVRVTTGVNNSVSYMDTHIGVQLD